MLMLLMGAVGVQAAKIAKAVLSTDKTKLTFYFDDKKYISSETYLLNTGAADPEWLENAATITEVVFDPSFADARPTSCYRWFYGMKNLTNIVMNNPAVEYPWQNNYFVLNTSEVTTMSEMFRGCSSLMELPDLYMLDTSKVTDMSFMFCLCSGLTSLNLATHVYLGGRRTVFTKFNTTNVITMSNMFSGCISLTTLNLSNFNTSSVTSMRFMFNQCNNLPTIVGVDKFDTSNVTDMHQMFSRCYKLMELKLPYNTSKVEVMNYMFALCSNLISVDISSFDIPEVNSYGMFMEDYNLSELTVSAKSAKLDSDVFSDVGSKSSPCHLVCTGGFTPEPEAEGGSWFQWKKGYFTKSAAVPYAAFKGNVLTFHCDDQRTVLAKDGYLIYGLNEDLDAPRWQSNQTLRDNVTKVVFEPSFANVRPVSCFQWFNQMNGLRSVEGMEYFNTSEVTQMQQMFYDCRYLTEVDVSHFNTSKVESMSFMFAQCWNLFSLDVSNFVLPVNTYSMFSGSSINWLSVPASANELQENACDGLGSKEYPYLLICPVGFTPVPSETGAGWIKWKGGYFSTAFKGDANDDGNVSIPDVMLTVDYMLNGSASNFHFRLADMNGDGNITVADVMAIVAIIMGN